LNGYLVATTAIDVILLGYGELWLYVTFAYQRGSSAQRLLARYLKQRRLQVSIGFDACTIAFFLGVKLGILFVLISLT
jgi:hypothetical protein